MDHPLNLIHIASAEQKLSGKSKPRKRSRKILAIEMTPTIQEPKVQNIIENINVDSKS